MGGEIAICDEICLHLFEIIYILNFRKIHTFILILIKKIEKSMNYSSDSKFKFFRIRLTLLEKLVDIIRSDQWQTMRIHQTMFHQLNS